MLSLASRCAAALPAAALLSLPTALPSAASEPPTPWPTDGWTVSTSEAEGLAADPLEQLVAAARAGGIRDLHSLLIVKNGKLVLEEYLPGGARDQVHTLQSVSKSVTATVVGVALHRGELRGTDEPLLSFFPRYDVLAHLDDRKRAIRLEHVLRMRLGMDWREMALPYEDPNNPLYRLNHHDGDWYRLVLDTPMACAPGERWLYNSGGTILLAGVLEHATGVRADVYADRHLFAPLGIRSADWGVVRGVPHTGGGLSMTARDLAKIGLLYLRDGTWDGERLLPEGWVARATTGPIRAAQPGTMPFGYGYLWWLLPAPADYQAESADAALYTAWGNMGQFLFVAPAYDLLFVVTGGTDNFADETVPFDLLYEYVLPAADPSLPFAPTLLATEAEAELVAAGGEEPAEDEVPAVPTFERTFGGVNFDRGISVTTTRDGGIAVTGYTTSFGAGAEDVYFVRAGPAGAERFNRTYGGPGEDCGWSIHELGDGGFAIAGFTDSFGAGGLDAYLVRTDADGDTLWTRTYGGAAEDRAWSLLPLADGGFALAGQTASAGAGDLDAYLVRTDADGRLLWERTYGGPAVDRVFSIAPTADGGFVLGGITYSTGAGGRDGWVVRTDAAGNEVWSRALGSVGYDVIHSVCATSEPGCLAIGYSSGLGGEGGQDGWVVKLDPDGGTEWTSLFGGARDDRLLHGEPTPDGGFALVGFTAGTDTPGLDVYLAKVDRGGEVEWTRNLGGRSEDSGYALTVAPDGGLLVTGLTRSLGAGEADLYLIKTDAMGRR